MKLFYTAKPLRLGITLGVLIFIFGGILGRFTATIPLMGPLVREMPIFYFKKPQPQVCLTFDISWGTTTLPLVLKVLNENQVPATFFLSGPWAIRHPNEAKAIAAAGHEIASHGDRHINLSQYPQEVVAENINKSRRDLFSVFEKVAPYFRPPNGDYDERVIKTARELGFETVIWSVDSLDWKNPGPEFMANRVLTKVFPGAIILCHASDSSKQIHLALPEIIRELRNKGYHLVTISQLHNESEIGRNDPR